MSLPYITDQYRITFPDPEDSEDGIVCYGGNLSPGVLLSALEQGIFPWYKTPEPIIWWSPDPRFVILRECFHIPKRLKRYIKKSSLDITMDKAFKQVINNCAGITRKNQDGTWITPEMEEAYCELHRLGYAHSVEAWNKDVLAGGLYGVLLAELRYAFAAERGLCFPECPAFQVVVVEGGHPEPDDGGEGVGDFGQPGYREDSRGGDEGDGEVFETIKD